MIRRRILATIVAAVSSASVMPALAAEIVLSDGQVLSTGRVVQVDMHAGRITIEHKPIKRFYMESMTMTFRVKDLAALTALTPGDKIRFEVQRDPDGFIITKIENSNLWEALKKRTLERGPRTSLANCFHRMYRRPPNRSRPCTGPSRPRSVSRGNSRMLPFP